MRRAFHRGIWVLAVLSVPAVALASEFFADTGEEPALAQAHAAFLKQDFLRMTSEIKMALTRQPDDPFVKQNVFGLLQKAYQHRGAEGLPADWHLPSEISELKIGVRRSQRDQASFSIKVYGAQQALGSIRQMQLKQHPNTVIADKLAGLGEWEESPPKLGERPEFRLQGAKSRTPIATGLYLLTIETTSGKHVDGWFIIDDSLISTASPEVQAPANGEIFSSGNPMMRWRDFRSPQYQPYERRSLWLGVSKAEPPKYKWEEQWGAWIGNPTLSQATIGIAPQGVGVKKLEPAQYVFVIDYKERRRFGDIWIGRDSSTVRPFTVQN